MSKRIHGNDGAEWIIYHVSEAGRPDVHDTNSGEWFFQPADDTGGEVYSGSYPTEDNAEAACHDWIAQLEDDAASDRLFTENQ